MKSTYMRSAAAAFLAISVVLLSSCLSSSKKTAADDPNFLGDFNPIQLENGMALTSLFGNTKPKELEIYLIPRTNIVEIYFRDMANKVCLILEQKQRDMIQQSALQFLEGAENGTLADYKPSAKNAYAETTCSLGWGVTGVARVTEKAVAQFNHEYLDGKPYYLVRLLPGPDTADSEVYSPKVELYFSPAQLRDFCAAIDQSALQALVDEREAKAYAY
ncbi:hypothetical protein [Treponema brennaborense]|uniref:Lipoprotein n=1 Tax=Treponema brennaborense (strain DSM 12168 / CIP 105900 / DD5/3) TaxID=906968 RepID=F4LK32_TREBD|nr:hypothetical protein [Treponema brennaborense]AEE17494.1 hypothetical protein Trebr_2079 [Treponema brennaborense DSM 12168]